MPRPYSYDITLADPFKGFMEGVQFRAGLAQIKQKQELARMELERKKQLNASLTALMQKENPTARDFVNIAMFLPEKDAESMRRNWETLNKGAQEGYLKFGGQVLSAVASGNTNIAQDLLNERAEAERNSGNEQNAKAYETYAGIIKTNPKLGIAAIGPMLAQFPGGEKVIESALAGIKAPGEVRLGEAKAQEKEIEIKELGKKLQLEQGLTKAQAEDIYSKINERAGKLNLDRDKLLSEMQLKLQELDRTRLQALPQDARKMVNDSAVKSVAAQHASSKMMDLAKRIEYVGGYGKAASVAEFLAEQTGNQDELTLLRKEYTRLRMSQGLKLLPPGPATDKDVKLALEGFLPANADSGVLASFLRGMAKLNRLEAATESAKADWVNAVGTLGRAREDIQIGNTRVPRGTTFTEYARQFLAEESDALTAPAAKELQRQQTAPTIRSRPYYQKWVNRGRR